MQTFLGASLARPSATRFEFLYRGYLIRHAPQPTPDGRFLAFVVVSHNVGYVRAAAAEVPDLPVYDSRESAAAAGLSAGQRWVDDHV